MTLMPAAVSWPFGPSRSTIALPLALGTTGWPRTWSASCLASSMPGGSKRSSTFPPISRSMVLPSRTTKMRSTFSPDFGTRSSL